ncbi:hypothetical protein [Pseudoalteromonas maricaloris]
MFKTMVVVCSLFLSGCAQLAYDAKKPLPEGHGLALARFSTSGDIGNAQFITRNTQKMLDNYSFVLKDTREKLIVLPLPVGTHEIDQVLYMQGLKLVDPDLNCLGTFDIAENSLTYIGDIHFHVNDYDNYILFSSHPWRVLVKENFEQALEEIKTRHPEIDTKFAIKSDVVGPFSCEQDE